LVQSAALTRGEFESNLRAPGIGRLPDCVGVKSDLRWAVSAAGRRLTMVCNLCVDSPMAVDSRACVQSQPAHRNVMTIQQPMVSGPRLISPIRSIRLSWVRCMLAAMVLTHLADYRPTNHQMDLSALLSATPSHLLGTRAVSTSRYDHRSGFIGMAWCQRTSISSVFAPPRFWGPSWSRCSTHFIPCRCIFKAACHSGSCAGRRLSVVQ